MRKRRRVPEALACLLGLLALAPGALAERPFRVDAREPGAGVLLPLNGVNDGPDTPPFPSLLDSYRYLGVPVIRTHDTYGPLDMQNADNTGGIFPDMSRDPDDPTAYNFGPADAFVQGMLAVPARVFFRIGYSWENIPLHNRPPADFDRFAAVAAHVVAHYNQGWNEGFQYGIRDWEIWNEPDGWQFWSGTPEQFFDLYERTARHMRQADPSIRVGGAGILWWNDADYRDRFVRYCRERGVPLDFFSWHRYFEYDNPGNYGTYARLQRAFLDDHGMAASRSIVSEWNYGYPDESSYEERCNLRGAAFDFLALANMQEGGVDEAHFYRGDMRFANACEDFGLHYWNRERKMTAYAFRAWKELRDAPRRRTVTGADWNRHVAVAGRTEGGRVLKIVIANFSETTQSGFDLEIAHLGACGVSRNVRRQVLTDTGFQTEETFSSSDDTLRLARPGAAPSITIVTVDGLAPWPADLRKDTASCPEALGLAWSAVSGACGYRIHRSEVSCSEALASTTPLATVSTTAWSDPSAVEGQAYCYAVEPVAAYGACDGDRRTVVARCPPPAPEPVTGLTLRRAGADLLLSWEPAPGAASYRVVRSTHADPATWGAPWRSAVTDGDPASPGVQWSDAGATGIEPSVFFYSVEGEAPASSVGP